MTRLCDGTGGSENSRVTSTFWPGRLRMRVQLIEMSNMHRGGKINSSIHVEFEVP